MANLGDIGLSNSFYDPNEDYSDVVLEEGWYPLRCYDVKIARKVVVKKYWMADVYNVNCQVTDEAGPSYQGREVTTVGIFNFLSPSPTDDWKHNNGGNGKYKEFCDSISVKMKEMETEEGKILYALPILTRSTIVGKTFNGYISQGRKWRNRENGKMMPGGMRVKAWRPLKEVK